MIGVTALLLVAGQSTYFPPPDASAAPGCPPLIASGSARPVARNAEWLGRELIATGDISLYHLARTGDADVVRFLWMPSFHPTVRVRIEGLGSASPRLIAVQGSERGGRGSAGIGARIDRRLTPAETRAMRALLDPAMLFPANGRNHGNSDLDGAEWLIERVAQGRCYTVATEHSPQDGALRAAGLAMLRLTGWAIDPY